VAFAGASLLVLTGQFERYEAETGSPLRALQCEGADDYYNVAFASSADGRLLAAREPGGALALLDAQTGKTLHRYPQLIPEIRQQNASCELVFAAGGRYVAAAHSNSDVIQVWEVSGGWEVARIRPRLHKVPPAGINGLALSPDGRFLAFGTDATTTVHIWEVASETEQARLQAHQGSVRSTAFSRDGKLLASGSDDGTVVVWDFDRPLTAKRSCRTRLTEGELASYWQALAQQDGKGGEEAVWALSRAAAQSVPYLRQHLQRARREMEGRLPALIRALDSADFKARAEATEELHRLGELAEPAILRALHARPTLEARRRLERLLHPAQRPALLPEQIQQWRSLEVLERAATPEARAVLAELARGEPESRLTRDAKATLERLGTRTDEGSR
jgi:hypothetical protein